MRFGQSILDAMHRESLTMQEVATKIGSNEPTISNYVNEKRIPRADMFLKICDALEIDPRYVSFRHK